KKYLVVSGLTVEMVLIDANVSYKIHTSVKNDLVNQFGSFLAEGKSIFFIKFYMNHSSGSYRTMNHIYKISVLSTTCVRICEDLPRAVTCQLQNHTRWNFQPGLLGTNVSHLYYGVNLQQMLLMIFSQHSPICVLRFRKIKIGASPMPIMCQISHLNSNMAEVDVFMLSHDDISLAIMDSKPLFWMIFFVHTPRKSVPQMFESRQVEKCIVMCTIADID
ncbi:LOW QUALITY PROTEIN: hypothetical protein HID58_042830, partial [Brassica napus]